MSSSLRCKIQGCDLDPCGVCRRCGDESRASHDWRESDRKDPCYRRRACERCDRERLTPDHDWVTVPLPGVEDTTLKCGRCGLQI